jgi:predicted nuclease with TOPRIM domain
VAVDKKEIKEELERLKKEISRLNSGDNAYPDDAQELIKYMVAERERTNRMLASIAEKIKELSERLDGLDEGAVKLEKPKEVPLSYTDAKIIEFVQTKGMACADDVKEFMHYKGRNAACARLNRLHMLGLLDRYQLGHKVYYKYDAGKAINTLIVSPPQ